MQSLLSKHGVDVTSWASGAAKGIKDLLKELKESEATLIIEEGRVLRCLRVAKMRIQRPGSDQFLVELKQVRYRSAEDLTGDERPRGDIPGEKMFATEDPIDAAVRGTKEELGVELSHGLTTGSLLHETVEVKPSASYPNLMSRYTFYEVGVVLDNLPTEPFQTTEASGSKRTVHFWSWHDAMIQPRAPLVLLPAQTRLLETLFAGSSRVVVSALHGGFSGSIVLRTDPYDADGKPEELTVTKLDTAASLVQEVKETNFVARLGASAIRVLRGPVFAEEQSTHVLAFAEARITAPVLRPLTTAREHVCLTTRDPCLVICAFASLP